MNIRYDRIIAWIALFVLMVMVICAATTCGNTSEETLSTPIEESNISIPEIIEIESSITDEESLETSIEESETEEKEELGPLAAQYKRYMGDNLEKLEFEKKMCQNKINSRAAYLELSLTLEYDVDERIYNDVKVFLEHCDYYEQRIVEIYASAKLPLYSNYSPKETKQIIWGYLRGKGFNEYVCAGIMGNIQAECGFDWDAYSPHGESYGICQWLLKYCPDIKDASLLDQLDYLMKTIEQPFNASIFNQNYKGIIFKEFTELQDEKEAAAAFMLIYERPASTDPSQRQQYATEIYKEFVG